MLLCFVAYITFEIYCCNYFSSDQFKTLKNIVNKHVNNCNELNHHIEELKASYVNITSYDYGQGELSDNSKYRFKRGEWKKFVKSSRMHNCSASVLSNVRNQPIKYLCKYFDIKTTEDTLSNIEEVLNAFSAAEQGKMLFAKERDSIVSSISYSVPDLIYFLGKKRLVRKLGFELIDFAKKANSRILSEDS